MTRFRVDETRVTPGFIFRLLTTQGNRDRVRGMARRAVAQSSINQGDVKSFSTPFPTLDEQAEITGASATCDAKIAALERESALLDELFRALLEALMTGRVSVAGAVLEACP